MLVFTTNLILITVFLLNIELIRNEDDEVLFAIAEELGKVSSLVHD